MKTSQNNSVKILSVRIDALTFDQVYQRIVECFQTKKTNIIVTPNPEIVLQAQTDEVLSRILDQSYLNIPDGSGLIWAAKYNSLPITKIPVLRAAQAIIQLVFSLLLFLVKPHYGQDIIPERITGVDILPEIIKICHDHQRRIFFLGAGPGVAAAAAKQFQSIYPNLKIAGCHNGDWQAKDDQDNLTKINDSRPDCLVLAFGAPREQWWIDRNIKHIPSVKLVIGVGGTLDFVTQSTSILGGQPATRAPLWIQKIKLEWLHRLIYQPDRYQRIWRAIAVFPWKVMMNKIAQNN